MDKLALGLQGCCMLETAIQSSVKFAAPVCTLGSYTFFSDMLVNGGLQQSIKLQACRL